MESQTKQETPKTEPKPSKNPEPPVSGPLSQLETWLYDVLVYKAPFQIPKIACEWIVKYGPWIALVAGIIAAMAVVPATLTALTWTSYTTSVLGTVYGATTSVIAPLIYMGLAVFALQLVLMFIAIPMLLKRQRKGWLLVFYSDIISIGYAIVNSFSYGGLNIGGLLGGLIGATVGFYLLFQIRSYYRK